jgi:hypothetical protein
MGNETLPKQFIFNEKLDNETLDSLYAGDLSYIEEIFATALRHFDGDFDAVQLAFNNQSIEDLKRAVHKIKPTFGFAGLLATQELCRKFEDDCANARATTDLTNQYIHFKNMLQEAKDIIQSEYLRLKAFNVNPL